MSEQGTLWEDVETRQRDDARVFGGARAPRRQCRECGKELGRRWNESPICPRCRDRGAPPRDVAGVCGELPSGLRRPCCGDAGADCQAIPF